MADTYAGIGARRTPGHWLLFMGTLATQLRTEGWRCRSGGAQGADAAFHADELYLPWPGFNGHATGELVRPTPAAYDVAATYHPVWEKLSAPVKALHARNAHIMLGAGLNKPVDCVVCWTPNAQIIGGTGLALRIALHYQIPVFNLARTQDLTEMFAFLGWAR